MAKPEDDSHRRPFAKPMRNRKTEYHLAWRILYGLRFDQAGACFWQIAAQHSTYVDQGTASANHALVVGAVADNLTISAQYSVLQRNRIEPSRRVSGATCVRTCHHRTSGLGLHRAIFLESHLTAKLDSLFVRYDCSLALDGHGAQQQSTNRFFLESEKETSGCRNEPS